jgi:hypothetical protein
MPCNSSLAKNARQKVGTDFLLMRVRYDNPLRTSDHVGMFASLDRTFEAKLAQSANKFGLRDGA